MYSQYGILSDTYGYEQNTSNFPYNISIFQTEGGSFLQNTHANTYQYISPTTLCMSNAKFYDNDVGLGCPTFPGYTPSQLALTPACDDTFYTDITSRRSPYIFSDEDSENLHLGNHKKDGTSTFVPALYLESNNHLPASDTSEMKVEEEHVNRAHSHPLYKRLPEQDGKYHCPQEGQAGCTQKPTEVKYNYIYVDSHLKPIRCNQKTCAGVQFSSKACLLRHKREVHDMHGRSAQHYLCHFRDCERAVPGHGFPRRYNLFDHMKRVHQYDCPNQAPCKPNGRKRKASVEESGEKREKIAKITADQHHQQARKQMTQHFLSRKQLLVDTLNNLSSPNDVQDFMQLIKKVVDLHDICAKYRENSGSGTNDLITDSGDKGSPIRPEHKQFALAPTTP